jgi:4-alpha-glucanotransferase
MKVLQFAFDGNPLNPFLPHNYTDPNCVVYTGTHDNDTTLGWFLSNQLNEDLRATIKLFANRKMHDDSPIHQDLIYLALSSISSLAVIPLQDLLGFGSDCRMNTPGVAKGNWRWRCAEEFLTAELADHLKELTCRFGRC